MSTALQWRRLLPGYLRMKKVLAPLGEDVGAVLLKRARKRAKVTPFSIEDCLLSEIDIYKRTLRREI